MRVERIKGDVTKAGKPRTRNVGLPLSSPRGNSWRKK